MRPVRHFALSTAFVAAACGGDRPVPGLMLDAPGVNTAAHAWVASSDGLLLAVADQFEVFGDVALVDVLHDAVEIRSDVSLVRSNRPLLWRRYEARFEDPTSNATFDLPSGSIDGYGTRIAIRNTDRGHMVRLARSADGERMTLQAWSKGPAMTWSMDLVPMPAGAGVALSSSGDTIAMLSVTDERGFMSLAVFDAATGNRRWSKQSRLLTPMPSAVDELVHFDDHGLVYVHGREPAEKDGITFEGRDVATGSVIRRFTLLGTLPPAADALLRIGETTASFGRVTYFDGRGSDIAPFARPARSPRRSCEFEAYKLQHGDRLTPTLRTSVSDQDFALVFGRNDAEDCRTRAMFAVGDRVMFIRAEGGRLRVSKK